MFQTYEPVSDRSFAGKHLPLLRAEMKKQNLDGFIIPHDDEYQNEYIPDYAERLMWATGFSGSAGGSVIMADRAIIFTDGRYTLQVRQQTDSDYFEYADYTEIPVDQWLADNAQNGARIGYDPMLHTLASVKKLKAAEMAAGFVLVAVSENPVDAAWKDQPARPHALVRPHHIKLAKLLKKPEQKQSSSPRHRRSPGFLIFAAPTLPVRRCRSAGRSSNLTELRRFLFRRKKSTMLCQNS